MAFITNQNKDGATTLAKRLAELIGHADQLDMLVGFFYFSGVKVLAEALRDRPQMKMRVLVGMDAEFALGQLVEVVQKGGADSNEAVQERFCESMKKIMGSSFIDSQAFHERVGIFINLLETKRLDIRKTRDPNHAKLYIFGMDESQVGNRKYWITGSSNFSEPGLKLRDELNVQIGDFGQEEAQKYFDELWNVAVPLTADDDSRNRLSKILKECSVAAEVTPFEAYFLVLQNYLEHQKTLLKELQVERILKGAGFTKYRYQVDAVAQALARLDAYHGVIIADVVGLGKSIIGGLLGAVRSKRGLIVCPPGLMGDPTGATGGWYEYLNKFKLHDWEVWSRGKLEDLAEKLKRDPDFDMVIVEEAHNFRSERTEDYGLLADICFGKEVVLLTATPFNNRPSDLLALLHLFSPGKQSPFVVGGELDERFRFFMQRYENILKLNKAIARMDYEAIMKQLKVCGIEPLSCNCGRDIVKTRQVAAAASRRLTRQIRQIMEKIVIRRNRLDLTSDPDYKDEITTLAKVQDPNEQFYELSEEQDKFYDRVIKDYFGPGGAFHGAIYHPQAYLRDKEGTDEAQENLYQMLRSKLVQRFESSFGAFKMSVKSVKRSLELSLKFVERMNTYLYSRKAMDKILNIDDYEDAVDAMLAAIKEQEEMYEKRGVKTKNAIFYDLSAKNFDGKKFVADIKDDIELMGKILDEVEELKLDAKDPKAAKLVRVLKDVLGDTHRDIPIEPDSPRRKVIVFSTFKDTIVHIKKWVEKAFPGKVLVVTGDNFGKEMAKSVKENFDASFDTQVDDYEVLLTTDKLSEGFNLNRAGLVVNYDIPWNPTRVIQRVGRINRIGKKVFDSLYIFNFFPTVKGSTIVANRAIAENKMFAIHQILGEDAKIFSIDEEPTPAGLYSKVSRFGEEEAMSFYTDAKIKYQKARTFLEKNHPEILERIGSFPNNVKTAWEGTPHATYMFRRQGPGFFALVNQKAEAEIEEVALEDALGDIELECKDWNTPRVDFSPEFWKYAMPEEGKPKGVYEALKAYKPKGLLLSKSTIGDAVVAIQVLGKYKGALSAALRKFAMDVADDIQNYGTIPVYTVRRIARVDNIKSESEAIEELQGILVDIRSIRGSDYLALVKRRLDVEPIVVTIEKR